VAEDNPSPKESSLSGRCRTFCGGQPNI
jgi:hypothetical protein